MQHPRRSSLLLLVLVLWANGAWGQSSGAEFFVPPNHDERGLPFFSKHFTPQEYQGYPQNWAVTQDDRGVIYVANVDGILEYDGVSWRHLPTLTNTIVYSIDVHTDGNVYAGTRGDFGYLMPDSVGALSYVSLIDEVPSGKQDFEEVWAVHSTSEGVYFQTHDYLFRWDGVSIRSWEVEGVFHTSFVVDDRLLVRATGLGLMEMQDDSLEVIADGDRFREQSIYMIAPYDEGRLLLATPRGLFLHDGSSIESFPSEVSEWISEADLYYGRALQGGLYALATLGSGVIVINREGQLVEWLHEENGLPDNWVNHVFQDTQGGLWLAFNNRGLMRTEGPAQLTLYTADQGLTGNVERITRSGGRLHLATSTNLLSLESGAMDLNVPHPSPASFAPVIDADGSQVRSLFDADSLLFAGTDNGLSVIADEEEFGQVSFQEVYHMQMSKQTPDAVLVGHNDGLSLITVINRSELHRTDLLTLRSGVWHFRELSNGDVWLIDVTGNVWRASRNQGETDDSFEVKRIPAESESGEGITIGYVPRVFGEVVFVSAQGFFRYDEEKSAFVEHEVVASQLNVAPESVISIVSSSDLDKVAIALTDGSVKFVRRAPDGSIARERPRALRFEKPRPIQIEVEADGVSWISDQGRLFRYDPRIPGEYEVPFETLIRRISVPNDDVTIYGGAPYGAQNPDVSFVHGEVLVEAAAPSFNLPEMTEYQFLLEGYQSEWSEWTTQPRQRYQLSEGTYVLRVRARNAQGIEGAEAQYSFTILPPWYRTWWAYTLYWLAVTGVLVLIVAYRRALKEKRRAREQGEALLREREVRRRMREANRRLNQANRHLKRANEMKEEILANTSHEFRTPLTAILGFANILKDEVGEEHREFLQLIEANGERLLDTVTQLLEIAELRGGSVKMNPSEVNVVVPVSRIVRMLTPLARKKGLSMHLETMPDSIEAKLDGAYLEQIVYNLVGNAIKFTDEGQIDVQLSATTDSVILRVTDTGIGIDEDFISQLFEEFTQESGGASRDYEGSGLGLSITSQLVTLMRGEITVQSTKGEGSTFTVTLPRCVTESNLTVA